MRCATSTNIYNQTAEEIVKPAEYTHKVKFAFAAIFVVLLTLIFIAPATLQEGSVDNLDGSVGNIDNSQVILEMNPLAAAIYMLGDINCHQMASNSYYINDNEMPMCARDVGIFIGLAAGMLAAIFLNPRFSWLVLAILILPILVDGGAQMVSDYVSFNTLRLITGILGGLGASYFLGHLINSSIKTKKSSEE